MISNCERISVARGLCSRHYQRLKKSGELRNKNATKFDTLEDRFFRVGWTVTDNGCWAWNGPPDPGTGYGQMRFRGKKLSSHRVSYEIFKGFIPLDFVVRHDCDNRICINPDHLSIGTAADNVHDAVSRGRHVSGERVAGAKLSTQTVLLIRERSGTEFIRQEDLAREYGVCQTTIGRIINNKIWRNV